MRPFQPSDSLAGDDRPLSARIRKLSRELDLKGRSSRTAQQMA
jgi:hypothetical protein